MPPFLYFFSGLLQSLDINIDGAAFFKYGAFKNELYIKISMIWI